MKDPLVGLWRGEMVDMAQPPFTPVIIYSNLRSGGFSHKVAMQIVVGMFGDEIDAMPDAPQTSQATSKIPPKIDIDAGSVDGND